MYTKAKEERDCVLTGKGRKERRVKKEYKKKVVRKRCNTNRLAKKQLDQATISTGTRAKYLRVGQSRVNMKRQTVVGV